MGMYANRADHEGGKEAWYSMVICTANLRRYSTRNLQETDDDQDPYKTAAVSYQRNAGSRAVLIAMG